MLLSAFSLRLNYTRTEGGHLPLMYCAGRLHVHQHLPGFPVSLQDAITVLLVLPKALLSSGLEKLSRSLCALNSRCLVQLRAGAREAGLAAGGQGPHS